jgi:DNA-binding HxlR family transcriptional regulator
MNKKDFETGERRSDCPISCSLELIGDKWSLLIIRDMLFRSKCRYNEFLNSAESISTNILSDRLVMLEDRGLISHSGEGKRKSYKLTKMGKDLKPVIEAIGLFGMNHFKGSREYFEEQALKHVGD